MSLRCKGILAGAVALLLALVAAVVSNWFTRPRPDTPDGLNLGVGCVG
jgi:hypothetical protein